MSVSLIFRYSTCLAPLLRTLSRPSLMCWPVAHARKRIGEARETGPATSRSVNCTLPAPPRPAPAGAADWPTPQLNEASSISFLCFASWLSPLIPSSFRKTVCGDSPPGITQLPLSPDLRPIVGRSPWNRKAGLGGNHTHVERFRSYYDEDFRPGPP